LKSLKGLAGLTVAHNALPVAAHKISVLRGAVDQYGLNQQAREY